LVRSIHGSFKENSVLKLLVRSIQNLKEQWHLVFTLSLLNSIRYSSLFLNGIQYSSQLFTGIRYSEGEGLHPKKGGL